MKGSREKDKRLNKKKKGIVDENKAPSLQL